MVDGSRCTKSKMPCSEASRPVMKVDHAVGLCGGVVVARREKLPCVRMRARFGRSAQCRSTNPGSMPSTPSTITCLPLARDRGDPHPASRVGNNTTSQANSRKADNRLPFHPCRRLDAEEPQSGGGDVFNPGIFHIELPV